MRQETDRSWAHRLTFLAQHSNTAPCTDNSMLRFPLFFVSIKGKFKKKFSPWLNVRFVATVTFNIKDYGEKKISVVQYYFWIFSTFLKSCCKTSVIPVGYYSWSGKFSQDAVSVWIRNSTQLWLTEILAIRKGMENRPHWHLTPHLTELSFWSIKYFYTVYLTSKKCKLMAKTELQTFL